VREFAAKVATAIGSDYWMGSNTKGSSLPNRSGTPFMRNRSERIFDRWMASLIMARVAVVAGTLVDALVRIPPESVGLVAAADVVVGEGDVV